MPPAPPALCTAGHFSLTRKQQLLLARGALLVDGRQPRQLGQLELRASTGSGGSGGAGVPRPTAVQLGGSPQRSAGRDGASYLDAGEQALAGRRVALVKGPLQRASSPCHY